MDGHQRNEDFIGHLYINFMKSLWNRLNDNHARNISLCALWNWPFINGIPLNFMMNCFISFPFRNAPCPILGVKSLGLGKYDFSAFVLCIINWAGNLYKTQTSLEDWSDISYILAHIKWETRLTWQGNAIFVWQFQASRSRETTRSTLDGSLKKPHFLCIWYDLPPSEKWSS